MNAHRAKFKSPLFSRSFWLETLDRAIKSGAQGVVLGLSLGEGLNLFDVDWMLALGFAGGAAFLSILTSIMSAGLGTRGNASIISIPGSSPPEATDPEPGRAYPAD